jgi:hypothetical protein
MAFAAFAVSAMPPVAFAVVDHLQQPRRKRRFQCHTNFLGSAHSFLPFFSSPHRSKL